MEKARDIVRVEFGRFVLFVLCAIAINVGFWFLFILLNAAAHVNLPQFTNEQFIQMGFFAASSFGVIVFLTMTPLQNTASMLGGGFSARVYKSIKMQLALLVLLVAALVSLFIEPLSQNSSFIATYRSELFFGMVASYIFSVFAHHHWVSQLLHQPYVVYKYVKQLRWEEGSERLWYELYECTYKAIKQGRVNDANYFLGIMYPFYEEFRETEESIPLKSDIRSLRRCADELEPTCRLMEKRWPFLKEPLK